jgi:putative NADH-flavin reductase
LLSKSVTLARGNTWQSSAVMSSARGDVVDTSVVTAGAFLTPDSETNDGDSPKETVHMSVKGGNTDCVDDANSQLSAPQLSVTPDSPRAPLSEELKYRVILFGPTGQLGSRILQALLRFGHHVTVFVRDKQKLLRQLGYVNDDDAHFRIIQGDMKEEKDIRAALQGQQVCINAAGDVSDPGYLKNVNNLIVQAQLQLDPPQRIWIMGGITALDIPRSDGKQLILQNLPFMSSKYECYTIHYRVLQEVGVNLDWSMMCPAEMKDIKADPAVQTALETVPFPLPDWTKSAIPFFVRFSVSSDVKDAAVSYVDVADVIVRNLSPNGRFSKKRVSMVPKAFLQRSCRTC